MAEARRASSTSIVRKVLSPCRWRWGRFTATSGGPRRLSVARGLRATVVTLPLAGLACGGGGAAAGGATTPENPASSAAPSTADTSAMGPVDAGPTTTTTTLGAGGDPQ